MITTAPKETWRLHPEISNLYFHQNNVIIKECHLTAWDLINSQRGHKRNKQQLGSYFSFHCYSTEVAIQNVTQSFMLNRSNHPAELVKDNQIISVP
jgi:hypothetical protein